MKSKGFRQIDTEYFRALMSADLTRSGYKVVLAVVHFTLGYQRDEAEISLGILQELTGLSRPAIRTAIKDLIAYGLISVVAGATNRRGAIYRINKDWRVEGKPALPLEGKPALPPEILEGPETLPPDAQNFTSRGKVPEPATPPIKEKRKLKKTKTAVSLKEYIQQLRERFSDLDFDIELEKCNQWWSEGTRKLQRPKLALLNWMLRARKIKAQESGRGAPGRSSRQLTPRDKYHLPDESESEYRTRMALKGVTIEGN